MNNKNESLKALSELEEQLLTAQKKIALETDFQQEANFRFKKNLDKFESHFPKIAKAIKEYTPPENFHIKVTESGHGNFKPHNSDVYLYSENPLEQAESQVDGAINKPSFTLSDYSRYNPKSTDERIHIRYMNYLGKLLSEKKEQKDDRKHWLKALPSRFPSAMVFGVGLGYHLPILFERCEFDYTFILEPDFEVFFASLFCTDWAELITTIDEQGGCLFLLVGVEKELLVTELRKITESVGAFSLVRSFCFQHTPMPEINKLINEFFREYFQFQFGHGFYNDAVTGLAHSYFHELNKQLYFDAKNLIFDKHFQVPAIIVGNGPSLDEAKDFIIENQNNCIIFACGTALTSLLKMGIKPDFHVLVERPYRNYQVLFDMATEAEFKELNLLSINTVYPDTPGLYGWSGLALKGNEAGTDLLQTNRILSGLKPLREITFCNPLVANTGLSYALHFGFNEIYLAGVDNGMSECGKHHSELSVYGDNHKGKLKFVPQKSDGAHLKGNLGGVVKTNQTYRVSNKQLEEIVRVKPKNVYNIGQGAFIKGTIPCESDMLLPVPTLKEPKKEIVDKIKGAFTTLGLKSFSEESILKEKILSIFEEVITMAEEPCCSTSEAANALRRQERYVFSFKGTMLSHAFHIFKGSLLYYHCPMVTNLFKYEEQKGLEIYNEINELWINYLKEMRDHFALYATKKCDWEFY